jgi:hypothetical protein
MRTIAGGGRPIGTARASHHSRATATITSVFDAATRSRPPIATEELACDEHGDRGRSSAMAPQLACPSVTRSGAPTQELRRCASLPAMEMTGRTARLTALPRQTAGTTRRKRAKACVPVPRPLRVTPPRRAAGLFTAHRPPRRLAATCANREHANGGHF